MAILHLNKQYIHMGVTMGPGKVDIHKRMKEAGFARKEDQDAAHEALSRSVKDFNDKEALNQNPSLAPISHELDGKAAERPNTTQLPADAPGQSPSVQLPAPTGQAPAPEAPKTEPAK